MAEVLVEKKVCESCGSEVRDRSAFCFNCGESVVYEAPPPAILKPESGFFNGRRADAPTARLDREPEPPPVSAPESPLEVPVKRAEGAAVTEAVGATIRAPRTRIRKRTEVEWVERSQSPLRFLVVAVVLAAVAGLLILGAIYLR